MTQSKGPPPLLERLGSSYLRTGSEAAATADDPIHVLNPVERAGLLRVVRGAIFRAALAGVLNAVATGLGEIYARQHLGHMPDHASLLQQAKYWGVYGVAAIVFAFGYMAYSWWASQNRRDNINHDAHLDGALTGLIFVGVTDFAAWKHAFRLLLG